MNQLHNSTLWHELIDPKLAHYPSNLEPVPDLFQAKGVVQIYKSEG